jgi:tetratricopeptide (TPR) repeat protein
LLFDFLGVSAMAGYRLASCPLVYPDSGIFAYKDPSGALLFKATEINLSGLYLGAGVTYYLDLLGAPQAAKSTQGSASKYEKTGDYYFAKKNYKYAASYYFYAAKTEHTVYLYKKIALCYFYAGSKDKAAAYMEKYLLENPSDMAAKKWLDNLNMPAAPALP